MRMSKEEEGNKFEGSRPDYAGEFRRIQSDDELRDFASSS